MADTLITLFTGLLSAYSGPGMILGAFYLLAHLVLMTIELGFIISPTLQWSISTH